MRTFSLLVLGVVSLPVAARADVPPPQGYVETCTVALQQRASEVCEECSTYYAEAQKCSSTLGANGYTQRCRTGGASRWTEIWCRPRTAADAPAPTAPPRTMAAAPAAPADDDDACAVSAVRRGDARLSGFVIGLVLVFLGRRGRRYPR